MLNVFTTFLTFQATHSKSFSLVYLNYIYTRHYFTVDNVRKISLDNTQLFLLQQNQEHVNQTQVKEIPLMDFSPVCKSEFWTF